MTAVADGGGSDGGGGDGGGVGGGGSDGGGSQDGGGERGSCSRVTDVYDRISYKRGQEMIPIKHESTDRNRP